MADPKREEAAPAGPKSVSVPENSESAMDECLKKMNLFRKPVAKDGSCLFRVVSEQIYQTQAKHQQVRHECIDYMHQHRELFESFIEGSFEHHLYSLRSPKEWGGQVEISALSHLYQCDFIVHQRVTSPPQAVTCNGFKKKIHLCYVNGNHYDAVYPLSFKTNAAMVQSLLYDLLLNNVFLEIDFKEKEEEEVKIEMVADKASTEWTEVKTKQKGKTQEENSDPIISAIPDAGKNQKIYWQIKRTLDENYFRNVELEVFEDHKTDLQTVDHTVAASFQFKLGDMCLATLKESEDESETIRVRIQEINPDKCRVISADDNRTLYYVQLNDLQPLMNGESYKALPGYYNKNENETEFQSQTRRRGKNRRLRGDEEQRKHENLLRQNEPNKRHDSRNEKDNRTNRRGAKKESTDKKKDLDNKETKQNTSRPKPNLNTIDKQDDKELPLTLDGPARVAKPAETAAAFWGRMRNKQSPSSPPEKSSSQNTLNTTSIENENFAEYLPEETSSNSTTSSEDFSTHPIDFISPCDTPTTPDISSIKRDTPNLNPLKSVWANVNPKVSAISSELPATKPSSSLPMNEDIAYTPSTFIHNSPKNFNLSTQASKKVNEVRENILASSAKMSGEILTSCSERPSMNSPKTITRAYLEHINNELKARSPNLAVAPFIPMEEESMLTDEIPDKHLAESDDLPRTDAIMLDEKPLLNGTEVNTIASTMTANDAENIESNFSPSITPITVPSTDDDVLNTYDATPVRMNNPNSENKTIETTNDIQQAIFELENVTITPEIKTVENNLLEKEKPSNLKVTKDKTKKKVSFGITTEIKEKTSQVFTQVPMDTSPLMSHSEPGKIVIPPDHREKHMGEFPTVSIHELQQQQAQYVQPSFVHTAAGVSYYASSHNNYQAVPNVVPMFGSPAINEQSHFPYYSRDLDGKDLPDDVLTLRHFYNLGVQYHYMVSQQQNNLQLNQPGLLPLPVQSQVSTVPIRPIVMATDQSVRTADVYSPSSQPNDVTMIHDVQHQNAILSHLQSSHCYNVPLQSPPFEEYELPPRLQRRPQILRGNLRGGIHHPRQILNGRNIVGINRQRSEFVRTANQQHQMNNYPTG